jgi:hypothetical protein
MRNRKKGLIVLPLLLISFLAIQKEKLNGYSSAISANLLKMDSRPENKSSENASDEVVLNEEKLKQDKIIKEYQEAAYELAQMIEKNNLDGSTLDASFSKLGREQFLKAQPEDVRGAYLKLEEKISQMQDQIKREDGIHQEFFNRYQTEIPTHLKNQRTKLDQISLPLEVDNLVKLTAKKNEINDQDIELILKECGRGESDCINKSFAILIEANHGLSEKQLKTIGEYL